MKKMIRMMVLFVFVLALAACGGDKEETKSEIVVESESSNTESAEKDVPEEKPSGINEDGRGEDPDYGEGIGEVIALSDEEKDYVLAQTTNSWLKMEQVEKDELVVLIGRWLEETRGYIVADYDELIVMLDRQMEQYYRNGVNEGVYETACDILGAGMSKEAPSGINEDGRGEDPNYGEGIGEVVSLSDEEKSYVLTQTTNSWLEMSKDGKDELVVLIGRWLEETRGYIVADYDELVMMLDHQMEQYYRNGIDEGVFDTVCDILGID